MINSYYFKQFEKNTELFKLLCDTRDQGFIHWKKDENSWSLLEIICHLRDEEIEDFRQRLAFVLEDREGLPPPIDPRVG